MLKTRRTLFFALLLILGFAGYAKAQTKIAYIDASKILKRMPEVVDAETRLSQLVSGWTHDADEMQTEISRKTAELERRKLIMTDAERTAAEVDLQSLRKKLDDFRQEKFGPNGEVFSQQNTLMKPAYEKLLKAIDEAAKELGYDYVLDRSAKEVGILYTNTKYDLTALVAHKLNIETDILSQPLLNDPKATPKPQVHQQPGQDTMQPGQTTPQQPPTNGGAVQPGVPPPHPVK
jgi:outer membrane protein